MFGKCSKKEKYKKALYTNENKGIRQWGK